MNRPEGNLTGLTTLNHKLVAKRVELVHEVVLGTRSIALLVKPTRRRTDMSSGAGDE